MLPVSLDGKIARMVLDTGAERSTVTRAAAARLRLRPDRWVGTTLRGAGGLVEYFPNVDVAVARYRTARLAQRADATWLSLAVTDADLGGADGLLGADILRHFVVDVDLRRSRVALQIPGAPERSGGIPLQPLPQWLVLAPVRADGHELIALVDTGASVSLINARGLHRLGLNPDRILDGTAVYAHGIGGVSPARPLRLGALQIGALKVADISVLAEPVPQPAYDMLLGMDVLGQQRFILSYSAMTLAFPAA